MSSNIRFISAGAGSGKTYRLTAELEQLLASGEVQPSGVLATTFTRLAATELRERARQKLVAAGKTAEAVQIGQALIGTVNSICGQLLKRFAFEAGLSPEQNVLDEDEAARLFNEALESALAEQPEKLGQLNQLARRLGIMADKQPDWRARVMEAVNLARSNNIESASIPAWGIESADSLLAHFGAPYADGPAISRELRTAIEAALASIDTTADTTKTTRDYRSLLIDVNRGLQEDRLSWSEWVKLSKASPGKKSAVYAEPIQMIAADYEKHPGLHHDIRDFCTEVFLLAAASLDAYQELKASRGMLDFVDQEQRLYQLLDNPLVKAALQDELQVLMVDEFQDTSPIQLALFMRLADLADKVIWVGDVKQAIYGFRGSDPELMQAVLQGVKDSGGITDILESSWRSRPQLVAYTNNIFVHAFAESLPAEQVKLSAQRKEQTAEPAVAFWHLTDSNKPKRAAALACGIREFVASGYTFEDKKTGEIRPVNYGDVAVLCRTNANLQEIAGACAAAGIPVAFKRPGLLVTPEGALAIACLQRLLDPRDTLASAEIRTLVLSSSPQEWLPERLQWLASLSETDKHWQWGEVGDEALPALARLAAARASLPLMSPSEAFEWALGVADVRKIAVGWGPSDDRVRHRLRNLDLLIDYALEYEELCATRSQAATVAGLILWLRDLHNNKQDWQAETGDGYALTLVSHHRAKGLEWPVVIACDMNANIKSRLWGLNVVPRAAGFDMHNPLADRKLRYWPWPFGQQGSAIPVDGRIQESAEGKAAQQAALEEARRLLYVSLTRPRDLLIIPLHGKELIAGCLTTLDADWMLPRSEELTLPDGTTIHAMYKELATPEELLPAPAAHSPHWVAPREPAGELLRRDISPSAMLAVASVTVGEIIELGDRLPLDKVPDITRLGLAIHGIIAARINGPEQSNTGYATKVLTDWGLAGKVAPELVIAAADRLINWLKQTYAPVAWHVEHPVTHVLETGQVVQGFIDLLLETEQGWILVDHKATPRPRNEWRDVAVGYSGQLHTYKQAIEAATNKPVLATWLFFPVGGAALEVGLSTATVTAAAGAV